MSSNNFTLEAAQNLLRATETAINNMITEIEKPVDPELNGSGRKAELASIKQTAVDAKELLVIRQDIETMIKNATIRSNLNARDVCRRKIERGN